MPTVPYIPDNAPFSAEQRAWLNGFFAGLFSRSGSAAAPVAAAPALVPLTILFGSQTGTCEGLAKRVAKEAGKRNFAATVLDMAACDATKLATEKNLLVIVSTYGDGEPPDSAKALHAQLAAGGTKLVDLRYSVCALGDTNYTQFCKCGADFDTFLEKAGATRTTPRADCDVEYEEKFSGWLTAALGSFGAASAALAPASTVAPSDDSHASASGYGRNRPYASLLLSSRNLNGVGSAKQVHHVEFDLADSGLTYEAGDALGVVPHNCPMLVADILACLGCDGEEAVAAPDGTNTSLRRALTELYDLGKPTAELLALFPATVPASQAESASPRPTTTHHVIDVLLARTDLKPAPADFVRALKKIQPRLYSISSSPRAHAGQVHLTVGAVRYDLHGRPRKGVCSTFLADRATPGTGRVGIFVHANKAFRPPANGDTPMIMIGPGTGIAPFRAFLHERKATGAKGKNWLFFGDQRAATDFLYRDELSALIADGTLTKLDTAFSRDQQEKIYVQTRMLEQAVEFYAWLEAGAHVYVCGDASRMAKDVDAALHKLIESAGKKTTEEAAAYVQALKAAKRYCRDVY